MRVTPLLFTIVAAFGPRLDALAVVRGDGCPPGIKFESEGYRIRAVRVESPFSYVGWVHKQIGEAQRRASALEGQPYRTEEVLAKRDELLDLGFLPETADYRVRVSMIVVSVEKCSEGQLDLVYRVFSSQVPPVAVRTLESRRAEEGAPDRVAGVDDVVGRIQLAPLGGYDREERLFGGARLDYLAAERGRAPIDAVTAEGRASSSMHEATLSVAGSRETSQPALRTVAWQASYLNASEPADGFHLRSSVGSAQLVATTDPLGMSKVPLRYGMLIEGGRLESDFPSSSLPPDTVASSGYGSTKLYVGATARLRQSSLAGSYGIELAGRGVGAGLDWVKHVGDFVHEIDFPVGDHRRLSLESRITAGILQVTGTAPVGARFFGGNHEEPFIPGDAWSIRSNPVIRSIPANGFSRTTEGPGGTRFVAYNLTASIPAWRKPIVPSELSQDPEFKDLLQGQIADATSVVALEYVAKDPHFKLAAGRIGDLRTALSKLGAAVKSATEAGTGSLEDLAKACSREIQRAERRAKGADSIGVGQVGDLQALLSLDPEGEDRLRKVQDACIENLNAPLGDASIAALGGIVEQIRLDMEREYSQIDHAAAEQGAKDELAYVQRAMDMLVNDLNIVSVGPVLTLDAAHLSPAGSDLGTRYGIGGGLRVTLANSVDFTLGYAANPKRLPGEPSGAAFFSIRFRDLLE